MHVVIFEGSDWKSLAPLSFTRPTFALATGASTLLEKQLRFLQPTRLTLWVRSELADYCRLRVVPSIRANGFSCAIQVNEPLNREPAMLVDGRTLYLSAPAIASDSNSPAVAIDEGTSRIREARLSSPGLSAIDPLTESDRWTTLLDLPRIPTAGKSITHIWDLLAANDDSLRADAAALAPSIYKKIGNTDGPWHLVNKDQIWIGDSIRLGAGCVIDASNGPVILASGAIIGANAVIQGPSFIGEKSEITPLSLIRPGTSIGPQCKLGGEVSRSIIVGFSNKAHEGYLGDSYVGEWVNLGAGTTTSNLKNTYGPISINFGSAEADTGRRFLGSLIGDHAKTAIGTRFMSGSYVGCSSMIATSAHAPRFTPSFTFSTDKAREPYRLEKAFEVARAMFARRNHPWTEQDQTLMRYAAQSARQAETAS